MPGVLAQTATFTFDVPSPVVYDVPFTATMQVNSENINFIDYDLSVSSTTGRVSFATAQLNRADQFQLVNTLSGPQGSGTSYRIRTETNGNLLRSAQALPLFTLRNLFITGVQDDDGSGIQFNILDAPQSFTAAQSGVSFTLQPQLSSMIAPQLSRCGDEVVGYADANADGQRQGTEEQEACDDGNTNAGDGCAAQCNYVELGWQCGKTNFGDRESDCSELPAGEFLTQKLTALINGGCYPQTTPACTHPQVLYKSGSSATPQLTYDENGKLDTSEKIYLITQISTALREFFTETIIS